MNRRRIFTWTVMLASLGVGLFLSNQEAQARCCRSRCNRGCGVSSCGGGCGASRCGRRSRCGRCGGGCGSNCGGYAYGGCATGGCASGNCATGSCGAPVMTNPDGTIAPVPNGTTAPGTPPAPAPAPAPAPST